MTRARRDGLYLLLTGTVLFLALGIGLENSSSSAMQDFRVVYYPARCLMHGCDPYNETEVLRVLNAEGGNRPTDTPTVRQIVTHYIYPPTAFFFTVPIASLPWGPAHILWLTLTVASLILASFLMWNLGAVYAPVPSGVLVGFLLANTELIVISGNSAGIVVSLCVVAVWCVVQERYVSLGILCLAISLAIKPHDSGLVWLYFLLAGGIYRKRAIQALLAMVALSLPVVLWTWRASPHWMQELKSNIALFSVHGGLTDPGPAAVAANGPGMLTNLQAVISVFKDDPRFYNPVTYAIFVPLLLIWIFATLRSRPSLARVWLALAAIATLSMLPVYHRQYDAKLLLLTVPACAMLWVEGGLIGWLALLVTSAGFVLTADLPQATLLVLVDKLHLGATGLSGQVQAALQAFPAPIILLVMGIFYLWVYFRRTAPDTQPARSGQGDALTVSGIA
jgi:hypothetical protein